MKLNQPRSIEHHASVGLTLSATAVLMTESPVGSLVRLAAFFGLPAAALMPARNAMAKSYSWGTVRYWHGSVSRNGTQYVIMEHSY